jgi:hypothetical protein
VTRSKRDRIAELLAAPPTDAVLEELAAEGLDRVARREVRRRRGADAVLADALRELDVQGPSGA